MSRSKTLVAMLFVGAGLVVHMTASPSGAWSPAAPSLQPVLSAGDLVERAAAGQPVSLMGVTVEGDVDLRPIGTLTGPFRCRECRLTGSLNAVDVVFERAFEVSDSAVTGPVDLSGAVFKDRLSFDRTELVGGARASSSRFLGDASCVDCRFLASADFGGALFEQGADFRLADFAAFADFRGVQFRRGGTFRLVRLRAETAFDESSAGGALDLGGAVVEDEVSLSNIVISGFVSLEDIIVTGRGALFVEQLSIPDLRMDPSDVSVIRGRAPQDKALELIERSAERRGELAVANDARYERLSRQGRAGEAAAARIFDKVFYRGVAGYLVRPAHPLAAFLVLFAACSLLRAVVAPGPVGSGSVAPSGRSRGLARAFNGVATSWGLAFSRKPDTSVQDPQRAGSYVVAALNWTEFLAYKVLIAVFLLSLGSSNSTVRQLIDAVRS